MLVRLKLATRFLHYRDNEWIFSRIFLLTLVSFFWWNSFFVFFAVAIIWSVDCRLKYRCENRSKSYWVAEYKVRWCLLILFLRPTFENITPGNFGFFNRPTPSTVSHSAPSYSSVVCLCFFLIFWSIKFLCILVIFLLCFFFWIREIL